MNGDEEDALVRVYRSCVRCGKLPLSVNAHGWCEGCWAERTRREREAPECLRVGHAFRLALEELALRECPVVTDGKRCSSPLVAVGLMLDRRDAMERVVGQWSCPLCRAGRREVVA